MRQLLFIHAVKLARCGCLLFLLSLFLTSCATIAPSKPPVLRTWKERETILAQIQRWQISGKIAVQTANDAGSASVDWTEAPDQYSLRLAGPLGAGAMQLIGRPGLVTLQTADGKHYSAASAEELLAKGWGFHLPITYIKFWIRGLPVPTLAAQSHVDNYHRITTLVQAGWQIQYLHYSENGIIDLPDKIFITSSQLKTKMIIYRWKINESH